MKKLAMIFAIMLVGCKLSTVQAQNTDPVLTGMILAYTDKAEKQLKSQEKVMALQTTGHIWLREEYEATTNFQKKFNDYLDSFRSVISYAAQVYGFYHEIGKLSQNLGKLNEQLKKSPDNALAVALTPRRNGIYRDMVLISVDIVNDIRQVCVSDIKMTEKERIEIVFGIRPKIKLFNKKMQHLTLAIKYTSLSDVWREIENRYHSYEVDKGKITDEAFRRWRSNGKIKPGGNGNDGGGVIIRPDYPWVGPIYPWYPSWKDSLIIRDPIISDIIKP